jgi:phosphotransferase system IIA component
MHVGIAIIELGGGGFHVLDRTHCVLSETLMRVDADIAADGRRTGWECLVVARRIRIALCD